MGKSTGMKLVGSSRSSEASRAALPHLSSGEGAPMSMTSSIIDSFCLLSGLQPSPGDAGVVELKWFSSQLSSSAPVESVGYKRDAHLSVMLDLARFILACYLY